MSRDLREAPSALSEPEHLKPKRRLLATRSKQTNLKVKVPMKDVEGAREVNGLEGADGEPPLPQQQQEPQQNKSKKTNALESGGSRERRAKASTSMSTSPKEGKAVLCKTIMWILQSEHSET